MDSAFSKSDSVSPDRHELSPLRRERLTYTRYQLELLNGIFANIRYPNRKQKEIVAKRVGITKEQVKVWFQNRRRKEVLKKEREKPLKKEYSEKCSSVPAVPQGPPSERDPSIPAIAQGPPSERDPSIPAIPQGHPSKRGPSIPAIPQGHPSERSPSIPAIAQGPPAERGPSIPAIPQGHTSKRGPSIPAIAQGPPSERDPSIPAIPQGPPSSLIPSVILVSVVRELKLFTDNKTTKVKPKAESTKILQSFQASNSKIPTTKNQKSSKLNQTKSNSKKHSIYLSAFDIESPPNEITPTVAFNLRSDLYRGPSEVLITPKHDLWKRSSIRNPFQNSFPNERWTWENLTFGPSRPVPYYSPFVTKSPNYANNFVMENKIGQSPFFCPVYSPKTILSNLKTQNQNKNYLSI